MIVANLGAEAAKLGQEERVDKEYKYGYGNPLIEVLCDFRFIPSQLWDMTVPGLFYDKIKNPFQEKKQTLGVGLTFRVTEGGMEKQETLSQGMQFFNPEKTAFVQIGTDWLAVNHLKPYPTWGTFKPMILDHFAKYREVASPKGLQRIGLRYINKIDIDEPFKMPDYFECYPFVPGTARPSEAFAMRVEIPYEGGKDRLVLALSSMTPATPNVASFLLDLDYVMGTPGHIGLEQVPDWLERAHTAIETVFEGCITDRCRALFKKEK